ncbi:MAG TPA: RNA polymerase sigma factor [Pyrinomonadaceae bacterium]|jgi:RNA polymerase sigma-70 factor (ECF subfamily)
MKGLEDDIALVKAVRAGDAAAEEQLYNDYLNFVQQTVRKVLRDSDDVEDVVQLTFIQIFQKLHLYGGNSRLSTWIYRVAFNQSLMYIRDYRQRMRRNTEFGDDALRFLSASRVENPERVVDKIQLEDAFANLAKGYARMLFLHDVVGLEHEEIAEFLDCHPGTSKSQLYKARLKMRGMIKGEMTNKQRRQSADFKRDRNKVVKAKHPKNFSDFTQVEYIGANKRFKNKVGVIFTDKNFGRLFVTVNNPSAFTKTELISAPVERKLRLPTTENLQAFLN